jgi:hypothetical protein
MKIIKREHKIFKISSHLLTHCCSPTKLSKPNGDFQNEVPIQKSQRVGVLKTMCFM